MDERLDRVPKQIAREQRLDETIRHQGAEHFSVERASCFHGHLSLSCEKNLAVACLISECNLSDWRAAPILSKIKERSVRIAWFGSLLLLMAGAYLYADGP